MNLFQFLFENNFFHLIGLMVSFGLDLNWSSEKSIVNSKVPSGFELKFLQTTNRNSSMFSTMFNFYKNKGSKAPPKIELSLD